MFGHYGMMHTFGIPMVVVEVVVFLLLAWVALRFARGFARGRSRSHGGQTPVEVLDQRLANGEIDLNEYRALREAVNHGS